MTGMMLHKKSDGTCEYSDSVDVLEAAGLFTIEAYMGGTYICHPQVHCQSPNLRDLWGGSLAGRHK